MNLFNQTVPITIVVGLIAAILTALVSLRSLRQQRRLSYLQSILQVPANRGRLQSILSSVRFLVAIKRLFPEGLIDKANLAKIGEKETDIYDILAITIYTRDRLFAVKIQRNKHNEQMEKYESYIYESSWIESWRSDSVLIEFKNFIDKVEDDGTSAELHLQKFVFYVKRFIAWCILEPQFDMIFSVSPRIRKRLIALAKEAEKSESFDEWLEFEKLIFNFYQGKGW